MTTSNLPKDQQNSLETQPDATDAGPEPEGSNKELSACSAPKPTQTLLNPRTGEVVDRSCDRLCIGRGCLRCGTTLFKRYMAHFTSEMKGYEHLKFITVSPKREAVPPRESKPFILKQWKRILYHCFRYRCQIHDVDSVYVGGVEMDEDGIWHLHLIVNLPVPIEAIPDIWPSRCEATSSEVHAIDGEKHLADTVAYLIKHRFANPWHAGHWGGRNTQLLASEGIGYNSAAAKEKRRQFIEERQQAASEPNIVEGEAAFWDYLTERLERAIGEEVTIDGPPAETEETGTLVKWTPEAAHVFRNGEREVHHPLDVYPAGETPPMVLLEERAPWDDQDPPRRVKGEEMSDQRFEELRARAASSDLIVRQPDGSRVRWRSNPTGQIEREVITPAGGNPDS